MRSSETVLTITKRTTSLRAVKGALHDGVNISVCESKWSVFSDPVTIYEKNHGCVFARPS